MADKINVLNNTTPPVVEKPKEQERINVSNIPPKSIGERELEDIVYIKKMTSAERNTLINLKAGRLIYNSTLNEIEFYNGISWQTFSSGNASP